MTILFVAVAAAAVLLLAIYVLVTSGKYTVERKLVIACPPQAVFDQVQDLRSWGKWGPWLMHDPKCKMEYSGEREGENRWYSWDGKVIGAGRLTVVSADAPRRIDQRLEFVRPFKSQCEVYWRFAPVAEGTEVCWGMHGRLPFLFRMLRRRMTQMLEKDYDFGLARLSGLVAPEQPHLRVSFDGVHEFPAVRCFASRFSGGIDGLKEGAPTTFAALVEQAGKSGGKVVGSALTVYRKVRPAKMLFTVDWCLPVSGGEAGMYAVQTVGGGKYLRTTMRGGYQYLPLVWHQAFSHVRMRGHKYDPKRPALEVYERSRNSAHETDPNLLVTAIYLPVKQQDGG